MMMSYFSTKVWTGKKQGKKTMPESLLHSLQLLLSTRLVKSCPILYRCQKFRRDNTDSKPYQVTRSPSHKVPSVAFKIGIPPATRGQG